MVQKTTLGVNTYRNVVRTSLLVVPNAPTDPGAVESCGMHLNLTADEVLSSTRAVRKRLDLERPVEREIINECLELAVQAPSGSNAQGWHFVIVDDAGQRAALAALYKQAFDLYINSPFSGYTGDDPDRAQTQERVKSSAVYLAEVLDQVPVHVVPCITGRPDNLPNFGASGILGSILPAAWSFMLAARERGLGTAWTTLHLMFEEQAAEILGIPFAEVAQVALIPLAYSIGTDFKPAPRSDLSAITHWNSWNA